MTNDAAAINAAISLVSANGGIVDLPAGTYNAAMTTIAMRSNVVLQGQSAAATKILYGPTYPGGVYFPPGSQMMGLADLSLQNVDLTSQYVVGLGTGNQTVSKVFLQRLNWNFGSGKGLIMSGDRCDSGFDLYAGDQLPRRRCKDRRPGADLHWKQDNRLDHELPVQEQCRQMGDRPKLHAGSRQRRPREQSFHAQCL